MTRYQIAKSVLRGIAYDAKSEHSGDKPAIRQIINDSADQLGRNNLTDHEKNLLANYACKLHPKD